MTFDQHDYLIITLNFTVLKQERRQRKMNVKMEKTPIYLKAITLRDINDISSIKDDTKKDMIIILRVTPLAQKDVEELRKAIEELYLYVQSSGGDIARLGEERVVVTPPSVKIWRGAYDLK